jgi:hypothetical protein
MDTTFTTAKVTIIDRIRGYFQMRKIRKQIAERRKVLDEMLAEMPTKPNYNIHDNDITY